MDNRTLGKLGENAAADYLKAKGYRILCRNFSCKMGEIDLIAAQGFNLIFAEVKTRQGDRYGRPSESVTRAKKGHIKRAASYYLSTRSSKAMKPKSIRFDVIEIDINHIRGAIEG